MRNLDIINTNSQQFIVVIFFVKLQNLYIFIHKRQSQFQRYCEFQHFIFVKAPRSRIKLCIFDYRKLFTHKDIFYK